MNYDFERIIASFNLTPHFYKITSLKHGLINDSFLLTHDTGLKSYVLQKINKKVFKDPEKLMDNIKIVQTVLDENKGYLPDEFMILKYINGKEGFNFYCDNNGDFWRIAEYIPNFQIGNQYHNIDYKKLGNILGTFLSVLNINKLEVNETIPQFHRLDIVFSNFKKQIEKENTRLSNSKDIVNKLIKYEYLIDEYKEIVSGNYLKKYIVHNDPKLSNFLFDENFHPTSLIDWDTIMPGYIYSDYADALRSILTEEQLSQNNSDLKLKYFEDFTTGFWDSLRDFIEPNHKMHLLNFTFFIVYEQSLRFFTDYLMGDIYYITKNKDENLFRAKSQLKILEFLTQNKIKIYDFIESELI